MSEKSVQGKCLKKVFEEKVPEYMFLRRESEEKVFEIKGSEKKVYEKKVSE